MLKNDNKLYWRVRISRSIQKRLKKYLAKNKSKIIPLLDRIIGEWLDTKGF